MSDLLPVLVLLFCAAWLALFALDKIERRIQARRRREHEDQALDLANCRWEHYPCCAHCQHIDWPHLQDRHHFACKHRGCPAWAPMA